MNASPHSPPTAGELPAKALDTTADQPWPVRLVAEKMKGYIERMPPVWVSGQLVEVKRRPGARMAFLTLRDADTDTSLPLSCLPHVMDRMGVPLTDGASVVVHCKPEYWQRRGQLQMSVREIQLRGEGDLLAQIELLKRRLADEGLLDESRKQPLPFLPRTVGLVCGRKSAAERDVVVTAQTRWPGVRFEIREVAVQGVAAVREVMAAVTELDEAPHVDVIVIARGGGSLEDLLAFSDEHLVRHVAACRTPTVSAIGHEVDNPVLDYVADVRAVTPTDAGRRVVPDITDELGRLAATRDRLAGIARRRVENERSQLATLMARPVMTQPATVVVAQRERLQVATERLRDVAARYVERQRAGLATTTARLTALSPQSTLERGYAVVQRDAALVTRVADANPGDTLTIRVADGRVITTVQQTEPHADTAPNA